MLIEINLKLLSASGLLLILRSIDSMLFNYIHSDNIETVDKSTPALLRWCTLACLWGNCWLWIYERNIFFFCSTVIYILHFYIFTFIFLTYFSHVLVPFSVDHSEYFKSFKVISKSSCSTWLKNTSEQGEIPFGKIPVRFCWKYWSLTKILSFVRKILF